MLPISEFLVTPQPSLIGLCKVHLDSQRNRVGLHRKDLCCKTIIYIEGALSSPPPPYNRICYSTHMEDIAVDEYLDLSVPVAGSGVFIQLHQSGALEKALPVWGKYSRVRQQLDDVKAKLFSCNQFIWNFKFAEDCRRRRKNFEHELTSRISTLENSRAELEKQCEALRSELQTIDPYLVTVTHSLVGVQTWPSHRRPNLTLSNAKAAIHQRLSVIEQHLHLSSRQLCKVLQMEDVPLPEAWQDSFSATGWSSAYKDRAKRKLIQKMISADKRRVRLTLATSGFLPRH